MLYLVEVGQAGLIIILLVRGSGAGFVRLVPTVLSRVGDLYLVLLLLQALGHQLFDLGPLTCYEVLIFA